MQTPEVQHSGSRAGESTGATVQRGSQEQERRKGCWKCPWLSERLGQDSEICGQENEMMCIFE